MTPYITRREHIERITVIGPMGESKQVLHELSDWRMVRSGPYTDAKMFPKLDMNRFLFVMERVVSEDSQYELSLERQRPTKSRDEDD